MSELESEIKLDEEEDQMNDRSFVFQHLLLLLSVVAIVSFKLASLSAQDAESDAREALEEYFRAWNDADNESIAAISNFPRISLGANGQVVVRDTPAEVEIDFDLLREAEGWDHSTLDLLDPVHVSEDKVHFRIVFSRRRSDGTPYRTAPGLYIITRQDSHWGLQLQSVLPSTFSLP